MKVTIIIHQTMDSDVLIDASKKAGIDMSNPDLESFAAMDGKVFHMDLNEEIKNNPNYLLGIINMLKTTFNSAPTEPPIVQQEPGNNIPAPPETPLI